jgi:Flp pilus assembly protein TadB
MVSMSSEVTEEATRGERLWMAASGACMIVAAIALLWRWNLEVAFVAATLGIVCWFLNMRNRLKKSITEPPDDETDSGDVDENQS